MLSIVKLLLDKLLLRRLLDNVFCQRVCIAYRTVHHAGDGIRALANYAYYFKFNPVGVQCFKAKLIAADILIFARFGVLLPAVGRENEAECLFADVGIAPAFELCCVNFLAAHVARHGRQHVV